MLIKIKSFKLMLLSSSHCSSCRCAWTRRSTWSTRSAVGSWHVTEAWMTAGRRSHSSAACTPTTAKWGRGASCGRIHAMLAQRMCSPVLVTACSSIQWVCLLFVFEQFWVFQTLNWMLIIVSFSSPEEPLPLCLWWSEVKDIPQWFLQLRCGRRPRRDHIWWHQEGLGDG